LYPGLNHIHFSYPHKSIIAFAADLLDLDYKAEVFGYINFLVRVNVDPWRFVSTPSTTETHEHKRVYHRRLEPGRYLRTASH
jgi:hypothetical protein